MKMRESVIIFLVNVLVHLVLQVPYVLIYVQWVRMVLNANKSVNAKIMVHAIQQMVPVIVQLVGPVTFVLIVVPQDFMVSIAIANANVITELIVIMLMVLVNVHLVTLERIA